MTSTPSTLEAQLQPKEIIDALRHSRGKAAVDDLLSAHFPQVINIDHLKTLVDQADVANLHQKHVRACATRDGIHKGIDEALNRAKLPEGPTREEALESALVEFNKFYEAQEEVSSLLSSLNTLKDVLVFRQRNA